MAKEKVNEIEREVRRFYPLHDNFPEEKAFRYRLMALVRRVAYMQHVIEANKGGAGEKESIEAFKTMFGFKP